MPRFNPNDEGLNGSQPPGSVPDFDDDDDLEYEILLAEFADPNQPLVVAPADDLDGGESA